MFNTFQLKRSTNFTDAPEDNKDNEEFRKQPAAEQYRVSLPRNGVQATDSENRAGSAAQRSRTLYHGEMMANRYRPRGKHYGLNRTGKNRSAAAGHSGDIASRRQPNQRLILASLSLLSSISVSFAGVPASLGPERRTASGAGGVDNAPELPESARRNRRKLDEQSQFRRKRPDHKSTCVY